MPASGAGPDRPRISSQHIPGPANAFRHGLNTDGNHLGYRPLKGKKSVYCDRHHNLDVLLHRAGRSGLQPRRAGNFQNRPRSTPKRSAMVATVEKVRDDSRIIFHIATELSPEGSLFRLRARGGRSLA